MIRTRTPHPPTHKPPRGQRWVCHAMRPLTGLPRHPDGTLQLCWEWQLEGKAAEPAPEAPKPDQISRGVVQAELFKI